jgi:uncharacterized membrane protein YcaP (DUF421 family)
MNSDNKEMFTVEAVMTAYIDENGNVTYVESSWDDLFKKEDDNA